MRAPSASGTLACMQITRTKKLVVAGALTAAVVASGVASALQSPIDSDGVIHACYNPTTGNVRLDVKGVCPSKGATTPISWAQRGTFTDTWQGDWSGGSSYAEGDLVRYGGSTYLANAPAVPDQDGVGPVPGLDPEWDVVAERGAPGTDGANGVSGYEIAGYGILVPASSDITYTVTCSQGKVPLSGGYTGAGPVTQQGTIVFGSFLVRVTNQQGQSLNGSVWAVCISAA
jgi:hypothetical protein